ncbi:hypothetical protein [Lysobacter brunescens]|uniref:Secreted protein n=1 Tax=Lysobacter brunescens TaxID=262323 RepID=A0ABW2YDS6_9GAMM
MGKWMGCSSIAALLLAAGTANAMETYAGVIELQDGEATFRGCERGAKAYPLRDAERVKAVAQLRARPVPQGFWYGEVTGEIDRGAEGEVLTVLAITGLRPGMGCQMAESGRANANPAMSGRPATQRGTRTADSARLGDDDGGGDLAAIGDE